MINTPAGNYCKTGVNIQSDLQDVIITYVHHLDILSGGFGAL